jgi:hypothetical protein
MVPRACSVSWSFPFAHLYGGGRLFLVACFFFLTWTQANCDERLQQQLEQPWQFDLSLLYVHIGGAMCLENLLVVDV